MEKNQNKKYTKKGKIKVNQVNEEFANEFNYNEQDGKKYLFPNELGKKTKELVKKGEEILMNENNIKE